jgi:trans-aconitate methyltransferase
MSDLHAFDLQEFIDHYNCKYYVESGTSEDTIDYALRFPFIRVYSIDPNPELVQETRQRFWYNNRVQIFERTHDTAFYELARIIPSEYSAVVWLTDHYFPKNIEQLAKIRPGKKDVIIVNNHYCENLMDFVYISKYFGFTHKVKRADLGYSGKGLVLTPARHGQSKVAVA